MERIQDLKAIDMHMHINHGSKFDAEENEVSAKRLEKLMEISKAAGIEQMFCSTYSSVLSTEEIEQENEYLHRLVQKVDGLYQWVVIDPRIKGTFAQAERMLQHKKCVGIKLHPFNHKYELEKYSDEIFSFASKFRAKVLIHVEKEPTYVVPMANKYPEATIIVAHLGDKTYVDAAAFAEHGNVYVDTSGMASFKNQIIEYAVSRIGAEKILFGTDTYAAGFQRGRIEYALILEEEKRNILRENTMRLFAESLN